MFKNVSRNRHFESYMNLYRVLKRLRYIFVLLWTLQVDEKYRRSVQTATSLEHGVRQRDAVRKLNVSRSTVKRTHQRFLENNSHYWRSGMGAKRKTTPRVIVLSGLLTQTALILQSGLQTAHETAISISTVRRKFRGKWFDSLQSYPYYLQLTKNVDLLLRVKISIE